MKSVEKLSEVWMLHQCLYTWNEGGRLESLTCVIKLQVEE